MSESFRPSKSLPALGYTKELGRRLENIRHYEPVTNLVPRGAGVVEQRRAGGGVLASPVTVKAEGYNGYFKIVHYVKYDGEEDETGHNYIFIVDGNSFKVSDFEESDYTDAGDDMPCGITYAGYCSSLNNAYTFPRSYTKNYVVEPIQFNAENWANGTWYIYLIFPFNKQPYLQASPAVLYNPEFTTEAYLIGTVKKSYNDEEERSIYAIAQQHDSGVVSVLSSQYTDMFKLVPTTIIETVPPEEEGEEETEVEVPAIAVCDGVTWDSEEQSSNNSICYVNNVSFSMPVAKFSATEPKYIYLHYQSKPILIDPETEAESIGDPSLSIKTGATLPNGNTGNAYYLLGQIMSDGTIRQNHNIGVVYLKWYLICPEEA